MTNARPQIVGIVNLTEDSFSDGGRYLEPTAALAHARALLADGADIVELGPTSSHPEAREVSADEEIARLDPVLGPLLEEGTTVSVDTWRASTQRYCIERRVAMINDIRGFADPDTHAELAAATCRLVVMHSVQRGARADRRMADAAKVLDDIAELFDRRVRALETAGVARARLILDPGMGLFLGSNPEPSVLVLQSLARLRRRFDLPLMISVSRKSFLGALSGRALADRGAATLAAELYAVGQGVDYVRTHDVAALRDALNVWRALGA